MPQRLTKPRRFDGLDRLRGFALTLMLLHHLVDWYGRDARGIIPGWDGFALTDVAAPAFTIALGASVPLLLESRRRRGVGGLRLAGIVLRRYGLLVPIGMALRAAIGFDMGRTGVLETLGVAALITASVHTWVRTSAGRWATASGVLLASPIVEAAAENRGDWISSHLFTGTFPLQTYVGLALLGAAAVPTMRSDRARAVAFVATVIGSVATLSLIAFGDQPDRYPGDASFLVPGITGTVLMFLLVTTPRLRDESLVGRLVQRAGAHTFGVFLGHYAVYVALRETGVLHELAGVPAALAAIVTAAAFIVVAPHVPTPPWSPRTGWRRPRPGDRSDDPPAPEHAPEDESDGGERSGLGVGDRLLAHPRS